MGGGFGGSPMVPMGGGFGAAKGGWPMMMMNQMMNFAQPMVMQGPAFAQPMAMQGASFGRKGGHAVPLAFAAQQQTGGKPQKGAHRMKMGGATGSGQHRGLVKSYNDDKGWGF